MDNGSGSKTVRSSSFPGFEQGIQPGAHCRPAFKLSGCGFSPHSLKWMNLFLANRRQRVKVGNMHSKWAPLSCGIPQGTVLGPTLFLVFINELSTNLVGSRLFLQMTLPCFPLETTSLHSPHLTQNSISNQTASCCNENLTISSRNEQRPHTQRFKLRASIPALFTSLFGQGCSKGMI